MREYFKAHIKMFNILRSYNFYGDRELITLVVLFYISESVKWLNCTFKMRVLILLPISCLACQYNDISTENETIDTVKVSVPLPGDPDEGGPPQEPDSWIPPEPEPQFSPPGDPTINDPDNPNDDE